MHQSSRLLERKLKQSAPQKKAPKSYRKFLIIFLLLIFSFLVIAIVILNIGSSWNGKSKLVVAFQKKDDIVIDILDPSTNSLTSLIVPGTTEVDAANNLGTWKLESIQKLGENEKLGGVFFKNTLIKSLNFPINHWSDDKFTDLSSGNFIKALKAIFTIKNTDLILPDRFKILSFAIGVGNSSRQVINLQNSNYLNESKLTDGSLGWTVDDNIPPNIKIFFTDTNNNLNLLINNYSGRNSPVNVVTKTVETLGVNIASIQSGTTADINCKVTGKDQIATKIAEVFACEKIALQPDNNFDIQIDLGSKFTSRF